jgi:hypothetical protein
VEGRSLSSFKVLSQQSPIVTGENHDFPPHELNPGRPGYQVGEMLTIKLFFLSKHHAMKACWGVDV